MLQKRVAFHARPVRRLPRVEPKRRRQAPTLVARARPVAKHVVGGFVLPKRCVAVDGLLGLQFDGPTIAPIPPSKLPTHPEYDDRMMQVVKLACGGKGADVRELLRQAQSYEASHTQVDGQRKKPHELEAMYTVEGPPPKGTVILVDDVLTTGAHFVAVRNVMRAAYPDRRVLGMFIARRVPSNPFEDFEAL